MVDDCLFCKIAAGDLPSEEVYSDDEFYAFRDLNPGAPHHVLIIPRKHLARISEVGEEDAPLMGRLIATANRIADQLGVVEDGFRYVFNCNAYGGQTVYHIHLHLLPSRTRLKLGRA